MKVSIAMAVYNGERFIREQIDSILYQLRVDDELVISVDKCTDKTMEILTAIKDKDERLKIYSNPYSSGVVKNFQNAVEHCRGDIIFYSDQDDVWMTDKVETVRREFTDMRVAAVIHDAKLTDARLNVTAESTFKLRGGVRTSFWGNFVRLSFIGCCMAFRAAYKDVVIPMPTIYRSHDWWTGCLLACGKTRVKAIGRPLILHRNHENNATPKHRPSLSYQLQVRWIIFKNVVLRYCKKKRIDKSLNV
ncbi:MULTISPECIES: glycosyltransferase [unclassified Butyricimonas]|jgi:rhamnosyltransferase|uniref:glycosyltransferase n=1 Tax=unclassified Butyricimonas TaxID=2637652 RepID=UPI000B37082A|nr:MULTISPECIES: glycosyltransferase [unclassified Butyricimonas]OUN64800.1 hypothetical protein B5G13_09130 [Butyricimonas sp. An62]